MRNTTSTQLYTQAYFQGNDAGELPHQSTRMSACLVVNQWTSDMWTTRELNRTIDVNPTLTLRQAKELAGARGGLQQTSDAPGADQTEWDVLTVTRSMIRSDSRFDRGKLCTNYDKFDAIIDGQVQQPIDNIT